MQLRAVLKLINLFLGLAAFLIVGGLSLSDGEEPLWIAAKCVGCFFVCWLVLGYLANVLSLAVETPQGFGDPEAAGGMNGEKE